MEAPNHTCMKTLSLVGIQNAMLEFPSLGPTRQAANYEVAVLLHQFNIHSSFIPSSLPSFLPYSFLPSFLHLLLFWRISLYVFKISL